MNELVLTHYTAEPFVLDRSRTYTQDSGNLKPNGLWLSDDSSFGWAEWCREQGFVVEALEHATSFTIRPGAAILHITERDQMRALPARYPRYDIGPLSSHYVDWSAVAAEYDGILITPYQWSARLDVATVWYYGWDVASACIWNPEALTPLSTTAATS